MTNKPFKSKITARGTEISVLSYGTDDDYICLTDIARYKNKEEPNVVIANWLRNRNTIEFLGIWEQLYNPEFKPLEFEGFRKEAGLNAFTLSPMKWVNRTSAIGITVKAGRGGGTFAHKDIAFEFASWISSEFKLYIIKDYAGMYANREVTLMYWEIGHHISSSVLGVERAEYGKRIVSTLSTQLVKKYGSAFELRNMRRMVQFAEYWTNLPPKEDFERKIKEILIEAHERLDRRKLLSAGKTPKQIDYFFDSKDES